MPHTVPNRPDERRGGTDGGEDAGAAAHVATAGRDESLEAEGNTFLDAFFFAAVDRQAHLFQGVMHQQVGEGAFLGRRRAGFFKGGGFFQVDDFAAQTTLGAHQLKALGDPDGPGDDRGDGQADHHDFHDDVGVLIHAPRRQVMGHAQGVVGFEHFRNVFALTAEPGRSRPERRRGGRIGWRWSAAVAGWRALVRQRKRRSVPASG